MKMNILLKIWYSKVRDDIKQVLNKWRRNILITQGNKNVTNRVKGRLVISAYKEKPRLDCKQAFFKMMVHSNLYHARQAVERFTLFRRIDVNTSLWRFKSLLMKRKQKNDPIHKKYGAAHQIISVLKNIGREYLRVGFDKIKGDNKNALRQLILAQMVFHIENMATKHREQLLRDSFRQLYQLAYRTIMIKRAINGLLRSSLGK